MTDEPLTVCSECGGQIRRVLFPAGIVFKGNGFYKTDHGNGSAPVSNNTKSDSTDAKSSSSSSEDSGTSKKTSDSTASATTAKS
jgi:predicted nucleic acid-binding Zn ribbon protein